MNFLRFTVFISCITFLFGQKSYEEAKTMIQNYVKSIGSGGNLCDTNTCCTMSSTQSCPITSFTAGTSTMVLPGGKTRCIFSDSTPYAFQVIPGDKDKLLFYFQGGGACWDQVSTKSGFCTTDSIPQSLVGVFDRKNSKNDYAKYTIVHLSYCSGDLFGGNVTRSYTDSKGKPVVQVGLLNAQATLDWVKSQMKSGGLASTLSELVVMGCSAGSIGTQLWGNQILKQLSWKHAAVVPDSYVGFFPDGSIGPLIYDYGYCTSGFLSSTLYNKCINKQLTLVDINMEFQSATKKIPYNFIQSKTDSIQLSFYMAVAASTGIPPLVITPTDFYVGVNKIFGTYNKGNVNFLTYLVDGSQHCFTPTTLYYEATTKGPHDAGSQTSGQWMYDWVNHFPLAESETAKTKCEAGTAANTYCDVNVYPKSFTENY